MVLFWHLVRTLQCWVSPESRLWRQMKSFLLCRKKLKKRCKHIQMRSQLLKRNINHSSILDVDIEIACCIAVLIVLKAKKRKKKKKIKSLTLLTQLILENKLLLTSQALNQEKVLKSIEKAAAWKIIIMLSIILIQEIRNNHRNTLH